MPARVVETAWLDNAQDPSTRTVQTGIRVDFLKTGRGAALIIYTFLTKKRGDFAAGTIQVLLDLQVEGPEHPPSHRKSRSVCPLF